MTVDANRVSLLPCPLCNCGMMLDRFVDWEGQPLANQVIIHPSPSECPLVDTQIDATPEAIAAWNRRSPSLSGGEVPEYDPDAPPDHSADNAADFIFKHLSDALGVDGKWSVSDGTETWDGDVSGTLYNILKAAGIWDEETNQLASPAPDIIAAKDAEIERLENELDEANQAPWPEWAEKALKVIRGRSGYDGSDDTNGVDLPEELEEVFSELEREAERHTHEVRASREFQQNKEAADHYRGKVTELCAQIEAAEARANAAEEALRPFAARCDEAVRPDDSDNDGVTVKTKHLRAARAFLSTLNGAKP